MQGWEKLNAAVPATKQQAEDEREKNDRFAVEAAREMGSRRWNVPKSGIETEIVSTEWLAEHPDYSVPVVQYTLNVRPNAARS